MAARPRRRRTGPYCQRRPAGGQAVEAELQAPARRRPLPASAAALAGWVYDRVKACHWITENPSEKVAGLLHQSLVDPMFGWQCDCHGLTDEGDCAIFVILHFELNALPASARYIVDGESA